MTIEHIKIFAGSSIIVKGLQNILDNQGIGYIIKDKFESARLAGFGEQMNAVELHVSRLDQEKALPFVEAYKLEINS